MEKRSPGWPDCEAVHVMISGQRHHNWYTALATAKTDPRDSSHASDRAHKSYGGMVLEKAGGQFLYTFGFHKNVEAINIFLPINVSLKTDSDSIRY